jgi:TetR/AcrR family transcriptional repressor of nem operon
MGRPAKFCKEDAVEIALNTFWEKGYEGTSVSELSAAMSITRSSFYNCFKTRDALFETVLTRYQEQSPDHHLLDLPEDAPIVPAIRKAFQNLCTARAADPDARGCLVINCMAAAMKNPTAEPKLITVMKAKLTRYDALIQRAVTRGELDKSTNTGLLARSLITHMIGLNTMSKIVRSEDDLWITADSFLTNMGLKP